MLLIVPFFSACLIHDVKRTLEFFHQKLALPTPLPARFTNQQVVSALHLLAFLF